MQFLIPEIGDKVTLSEDWEFVLYDEYRNKAAVELLPRNISKQPRTHEEVMDILERNARSDFNGHKKWVERLKWEYEYAKSNPERCFGKFVQKNRYYGYVGEYVLELTPERVAELVEKKRQVWQKALAATETIDEIVERLKNDKHNGYDYWLNGKDRPEGGITTLPKDSELTVDRIYIRKGASEFSSITFYLNSFGGKPLKEVLHFGKKVSTVRFWAKLEDVNNMRISKYVQKKQKKILTDEQAGAD